MRSTTFASSCRRRDREPRVLHVVRVGRAVATERPQEREDVSVDDREHLVRREVLEPRPAHVLVGAPLLVFALWEDPALHRLLESRGLVLLQDLQVVQPAQEEQVGDLLDHLKRVGDATRPEGVPDLVDLALDGSRDHERDGMSLMDLRGAGSVLERLRSRATAQEGPVHVYQSPALIAFYAEREEGSSLAGGRTARPGPSIPEALGPADTAAPHLK